MTKKAFQNVIWRIKYFTNLIKSYTPSATSLKERIIFECRLKTLTADTFMENITFNSQFRYITLFF